MAEKVECGKCMEKIVEIINTNAAGMTKDDREWLLTQDEATLDRFLSKKPVAPVVHTEVALTDEQVMNALSAENKAALAYGKKQLAERKANMVKTIQDNTSKEIWPDAVLTAMNEDTLERIFNSVKKKEEIVDYSLNGAGSPRRIEANAEVAVLFPTGFGIVKK